MILKKYLRAEKPGNYLQGTSFKKGFFIESPPDRGPNRGKDLLVTEELSGHLGKYKFR